MNQFDKLFQQSLHRYKLRKISVNPTKLRRLLKSTYKKASKYYDNLPPPIICSRTAYISLWLKEIINQDIAQIRADTIAKSINRSFSFTASTDFLVSYPRELFSQNMAEKHSPDMKHKWLAMIKERNLYSSRLGHNSRLDMYLQNYLIPPSEYYKFITNIRKIIPYCNKHITINPSSLSLDEFNKMCFICNISSFPINNKTDLLNKFRASFPFIKKYTDKIIFVPSDHPEIKYIKTTDTFKITSDSQLSQNHQLMDYIHEFSHLALFIKTYHQNQIVPWIGVYHQEKQAIITELNFIKKHYPKIYPAKLGVILQIIHKTLFEIDIYQHPDQDPDLLYAKHFNTCFPFAHQTINHGYLFETDLIYNNFSLLPYAIAYTNTLAKIM